MCLDHEALKVVSEMLYGYLVCSVGAGAEGWRFLLLSSSAVHTHGGF